MPDGNGAIVLRREVLRVLRVETNEKPRMADGGGRMVGSGGWRMDFVDGTVGVDGLSLEKLQENPDRLNMDNFGRFFVIY